MSTHPNAAKPSQFTIVELLAVMLVVVILAAEFRVGSERQSRVRLENYAGPGTSGAAPK